MGVVMNLKKKFAAKPPKNEAEDNVVMNLKKMFAKAPKYESMEHSDPKKEKIQLFEGYKNEGTKHQTHERWEDSSSSDLYEPKFNAYDTKGEDSWIHEPTLPKTPKNVFKETKKKNW